MLVRYYPMMLEGGAHPHHRDNSSCPYGIDWIYNIFGDCVDDQIKYAGFLIGFISLMLWLLPMIPQIYENYKNKRCDGISIYFIAFWMFGDSCNMSGAILTKQLPLQQIMGVYYILQDIVILGQYTYYTRIYPKRQISDDYRPIDTSSSSSSSTARVTVPCLLIASIFAGAFCMTDTSSSVDTASSTYTQHNRRLLGIMENENETSIFTTKADMLGYIIGSVACAAYFGGRLPQIYQNYKRKTLEGLSRFMFIIIWFGNLTYGVSVLMGGTGSIYMIRHLPWLLGSLGLCVFDVVILVQYIMYGTASMTDQSALISDNSDQDDDDDAPLIRPGTII